MKEKEKLTSRIKDLYELYHQELIEFQRELAPHYPMFKRSLRNRYGIRPELEDQFDKAAHRRGFDVTEKEKVEAVRKIVGKLKEDGVEMSGGVGGPQSVEMENEISWLLIRDLKPDIVIELGPCSGWSTAYLIDAVLRNDIGKVISYDILDHSVENLKQVWRWIVDSPGEGKLFDPIKSGVWELRKGDTYATFDLDAILDEGKIGYVSIDSDHSGNYARWYIKEILENLPPGCGVAIHDIVQSKTGECPDPRVNQSGIPLGYGSRFDSQGRLTQGVDDHDECRVIWEYLVNNQISYINPNPGHKNDSVGKQIGELRRRHSYGAETRWRESMVMAGPAGRRVHWALPPPLHDCEPSWSSAIFYIKS